MKRTWLRRVGPVAWLLASAGVLYLHGACNEGVIGQGGDGSAGDQGEVADLAVTDLGDGGAPICTGGLDQDKDGYGKGCPAGNDCNDSDATIHPGAKELCDGVDNDCDNLTDENVTNACGTCDPGCFQLGKTAFPTDKTQDTSIKDINGVGTDGNGDLVLDKTNKNFNYMWIANTFDTLGADAGCRYATDSTYKSSLAPYCRGTISKINTTTMKEEARYYSTTCYSKAGTTGCLDLNGKTITKDFPHAPSRTAVDFNFDVWVANRAFGGQPSATKIANDTSDCQDRNKNGVIDTSKDWSGDGLITTDCNADSTPDTSKTTCTGTYAGKKPEFLGDDDECILFTVNYGDAASSANTDGDIGRSICLDTGAATGGSNAWVGTFDHNNSTINNFYRIDGTTGKLSGPYALASGHRSYGCAVDGKGILWSADLYGTLAYLNTTNPTLIGASTLAPSGSSLPSTVYFYGVGTDGNDHVWLGGYASYFAYRYVPDHSTWAGLAKGTWTWIKLPTVSSVPFMARGVAADKRGKVWLAINQGYIMRLDQSIGSGYQDQSASLNYWPTKGTTIIGVGVDFLGHVWGISYTNGLASRLDVDQKGDVITPATGTTKNVNVGYNPYTYSDFTGYGLQNFTRPSGRYLYQVMPCPSGHKATWKQLSYVASTPTGTSVSVRLRSGDSEATMGTFAGPYSSSPIVIKSTSTDILTPNPSILLQIEFTLTTTNKAISPVVKDLDLAYTCADKPE